eukprot:ANDGO_02656.mRNA.1 hypothetical protein
MELLHRAVKPVNVSAVQPLNLPRSALKGGSSMQSARGSPHDSLVSARQQPISARSPSEHSYSVEPQMTSLPLSSYRIIEDAPFAMRKSEFTKFIDDWKSPTNKQNSGAVNISNGSPSMLCDQIDHLQSTVSQLEDSQCHSANSESFDMPTRKGNSAGHEEEEHPSGYASMTERMMATIDRLTTYVSQCQAELKTQKEAHRELIMNWENTESERAELQERVDVVDDENKTLKSQMRDVMDRLERVEHENRQYKMSRNVEGLAHLMHSFLAVDAKKTQDNVSSNPPLSSIASTVLRTSPQSNRPQQTTGSLSPAQKMWAPHSNSSNSQYGTENRSPVCVSGSPAISFAKASNAPDPATKASPPHREIPKALRERV